MLKLAIEQPAKQLGVNFENGLVKQIIKDIRVDNTNVNLSILQLLLNRLWDEQQPRLITNESYDRISGDEFNRILIDLANKIYDEFLILDRHPDLLIEIQTEYAIGCELIATSTCAMGLVLKNSRKGGNAD